MQTRTGPGSTSQNLDGVAFPQQGCGNLGKALTSYDVANGKNLEQELVMDVEQEGQSNQWQQQQQEQHPSQLTIQIPSQPSTNDPHDGERDRSSTLGSEFDLHWSKDRGMSISCLLTPLGELHDDHDLLLSTNVNTEAGGGTAPPSRGLDGNQSEEGTSATVSTSSVSVNSAALPMPQCSSTGVALHHPLPSLAENSSKQKGASSSSPESTSVFFSEENHQWGQHHHQQQQRTSGHATLFSHTPPTHCATSYEQRHFQKRMRAGSISGRLRSASDLEDIGIINNDQKAILKDLLISGNDQVQAAIDKYEAGDSSALEEMISSGAFSRSVDVDLLGDLDLDLDFLNVHEDDELVFGTMEEDDMDGHDHVVGVQHRGVARKQVGKMLAPMDMKSVDPGAQPYHYSGDDGIGDLEFNGDMSVRSHDTKQEMGPQHTNASCSEDALEVHRMRTNSLALPGLMLEGAHQDDIDQITFGQWMDSDLPMLMNGIPSYRQGAASNVVNANGSQYLLQNQNAMLNADGSSNSFKLQCDLLMQREGDRPYEASPPAVASVVLEKRNKIKKKAEPPKKPPASPNLKKEKKPKKTASDVSEGKKSKKKSTDPKEVYSTNSIPFVKRDKGGDDDVEDNKEVPSGLGRPRSMSDPNLSVRLDELGLLHVNGPKGWVGAYSPDSREIRINRFLEKRNHRVWVKKVKYDVRKNFADSRLRVKGRFVKKEDEMLMRELMSLT
eukprot:CCRYP_014534-RA/>CCRYP_014534-RA protein AED:0.01 eAED:0.01 QI:236/1/1/1/1/1/2/342/724